MFKHIETGHGGEDPNKGSKIERSTTPDGDPLPSSIDFATGHRTGTIPGSRKDFAAGLGLDPKKDKANPFEKYLKKLGLDPKKDRAYTLEKDLERLEKQGLRGKVVVLEPPDVSFNCYQLTFFNGVRDKGSGKKISAKDVMRYLEQFKTIGTRYQFESDPSLYEKLAYGLTKEKGKYKDHYIAIYKIKGEEVPVHVSPIERVYRKEDGTFTIKLWGKWGRYRSTFRHDIENVTPRYLDQGQANWEILFGDEQGLTSDFGGHRYPQKFRPYSSLIPTDRPNGRIMDL